MLLKNLIPMLFSYKTADKNRTVRIQLASPDNRYLYEGKISEFYEKMILKQETIFNYKNETIRLGTSIGRFSVMNFTHYKDDDKCNVPECNWPINIVIY